MATQHKPARRATGKTSASREFLDPSVQKLKDAKKLNRDVNAAMAPIKRAAQEINRINRTANKRSIFDTPEARATANAFSKVTDEPTDYQGAVGRMFEVVLAKQKLAANGPQTSKELDVDEIRSHLFTVIGDAGWERALFFLAQCARLWAELPGPVKFTDRQKELMHAMSSALNNLLMDGRAIDRASKAGL